jgi:predicted Zn-ribbon and HTH transcriptional regulator
MRPAIYGAANGFQFHRHRVMTYEDFMNKMPESLRESHKQMRSALNAAHSFALSGFATTPPEALAAREAICRACPEWDAQALNKTGRCRKCGCSTWAKLRMATERCPIGKWEAFDTNPTQ